MAHSTVSPLARYTGKRIRRLRHSRGWTTEVLGGLAKIDKSVISRLERGLVEPPLSSLKRVLRALKVEWNEVLPRVMRTPPNDAT